MSKNDGLPSRASYDEIFRAMLILSKYLPVKEFDMLVSYFEKVKEKVARVAVKKSV